MSGNIVSNSPAMKRRAFIGIAIAIVVLIGLLVIVLVSAREPVSLTFLEYHRSFHDAKLKLTNGSRKTITYLTDHDDVPVLCRLKTSEGWTNTSRPISIGTSWTPDGKTNQIYLFADWPFPRPGGPAPRLEFLQAHELGPGQSTEFYFDLKVDGPPMRVGVVCCTPPGKLARQFGQWRDRVKLWCRIKSYSKPPGEFDVWCDETLQLPTAPVNEENVESR
jgi:hypothetical protein